MLFDLFLFVSHAWQEEDGGLVFGDNYSQLESLLISVL